MEPMFLDRPPIMELLLAMAVVGFLVGLVWIHQISGLDEDPGPSIFRDRDERDPLLAELRDLTFGLSLSLPIPSLSLPSPIHRRLTVRWLVTRLELGVGIVCVVAASLSLVVWPTRSLPMFMGPDWGMPLAVSGTVGCAVGLVWMVRIARRPSETGSTIWRSRQD